MDLVPQTVWFGSLYNYYKQNNKSDDWKKIKNKIYSLEGRHCWICDSIQGYFEAHEFWEYDEKKKTQKLIGIHHLCSNCHKIKHYGLWTQIKPNELKEQGLTEKDLINHFCKVNNCSINVFEEYKKESFNIFNKRSLIEWKTDFSFIKTLNLDITIPKELPNFKDSMI